MSTEMKYPRPTSRKAVRIAEPHAARTAAGIGMRHEKKTGIPFTVLIHDFTEDPGGFKFVTRPSPGREGLVAAKSDPKKAVLLKSFFKKLDSTPPIKSSRNAHMVSFVIEPEHRHLEAPLIKAFELFSSVIEQDATRMQTEKMRLMCQLLIQDIELPRTAVTEAKMRADAIRHLLEKGKWLKAADIAKLGDYSGSNPAAPANRWKKEGKVFAVNFKDQDLFAAYQFSDAMTPRPVIAKVLSIFKDKRDPWKIAAWFASVNSWLGGMRPQDCLDNPDAVIAAAKQEIAGFDG